MRGEHRAGQWQYQQGHWLRSAARAQFPLEGFVDIWKHLQTRLECRTAPTLLGDKITWI